jgi:hypothetical protein
VIRVNRGLTRAITGYPRKLVLRTDKKRTIPCSDYRATSEDPHDAIRLYTSSIYALHPFFGSFRSCANLFEQLNIDGVVPKGEGDVDKKGPTQRM